MLRKNGYKNNTYTVLEICGTIALVVRVLYVLRHRIVFSCPGADNTGDFYINLNSYYKRAPEVIYIMAVHYIFSGILTCEIRIEPRVL